MTDIETLFQSVDCPVCRAPAGAPCVFRVTMRGAPVRKSHIGRQSLAIARDRRDRASYPDLPRATPPG